MISSLFIAAMTQMLVITAERPVDPTPKFFAPIKNEVEGISNTNKAAPAGALHHWSGLGHRETTCYVDDIFYRLGAPVMNEGVTMYYIYYGEKWSADEKILLEDFGRKIGKSDWYGMTRRYYSMADKKVGGLKKYVNCNITVSTKIVHDTNYTLGKKFDSGVASIIQKYLDSGDFPIDVNGIYTVFTDEDVQHAGLCTSFCAYHGYMYYNKNWTDPNSPYYKLKFQYTPKASCNPCNVFLNRNLISPYEKPFVEGMMTSFAHEITETVTDPLLNAWYDGRGEENADKCSWTFGDVKSFHVEPNKTAVYNAFVGHRKYLIQQNWDLDSKSCAMKSHYARSCWRHYDDEEEDDEDDEHDDEHDEF